MEFKREGSELKKKKKKSDKQLKGSLPDYVGKPGVQSVETDGCLQHVRIRKTPVKNLQGKESESTCCGSSGKSD